MAKNAQAAPRSSQRQAGDAVGAADLGRRVAENANGGTDHGAAAPMFIVGDKIKAGLLGKYPSLAPQDLFEGDIKYNVDFRSVYAGVLEQWLKTPSAPILGRQFEPLRLV